jgi:glycosidase
MSAAPGRPQASSHRSAKHEGIPVLKCTCRWLLSACLTLLSVSASAYDIRHLEPPSWWLGMKQTQLQLMVHGENLGELTPSLNYPGVQLKGVTRVASRNYLFLDLEIGEAAPAGDIQIEFSLEGKPVLRHSYPLAARQPGSAERRGFNATDAIYLITPDRFANGIAANDSLASLREKANRANPAGRHGGDLQGISEHLDYISKMGFTQIWSTPLVENDQPQTSYHGYATTNLYQVDARFGSNAEYRDLVAKAKAQGLGFIQDVVLNHIGSGHWWMRDLPSADWLNFQGKPAMTNHQRSTLQDPHAAAMDRKTFSDGWFVESMPDLNQRNPLLANYLIQNTLWWIEYAGLSGLRTDTYPYSDPAFTSRWSGRVMQEYPNFNIVGEEWSASPAQVSYWQRGKRNADQYQSYAPSMMDFPFFEVLTRGLLGDEKKREQGFHKWYQALANDFLYPAPQDLVIFDGNHDTNRLFSELGGDHDLYRMAMVGLATLRGIPQFTYGTEILMSSPKKRDDGRVRADFPGGWPGDRVNGFTGQGLSKAQKQAQQFVAQLLNWRKKSPAVHYGRLLHFAPEHGTYVYFRYDGQSKVMVVFNKNSKPATLDLSRFAEVLNLPSRATDVLAGRSLSLATSLTVPARSATILEIDQRP